MELTTLQIKKINHNFPKVDLPYETTGSSNITPDYNIALAIPYGKKSYLWFTFENGYETISKGRINFCFLLLKICLFNIMQL